MSKSYDVDSRIAECLDAAQTHRLALDGTTYASDGVGTIASAVEIMRSKELELRTDIAKRIGAVITVFGA